MKILSLNIGDRTATARIIDGDDLIDALSRAAAKLGWRGGAWPNENAHLNGSCTVTKMHRRWDASRACTTAHFVVL
jgi:hypothetical protein